MARVRKPMEFQNKNLTKEEKQEKEMIEAAAQAGSEQLKTKPTWLRDDVAKREWQRLHKIFENLNIINNLDYNNLGTYCNAFSSYIEACEKMKGESFVIVNETSTGKNRIANPLINIQLKYSEEMRKYSSLLGLSIDSRLKLADLKLKKAKSDIEDDFGDL